MSPKYKIIPDRDYILWQLPCSESGTGMGYVINTADGRNFVIDGGDESCLDMLCTFIREKCAGKVSAWFLTHPHPGHAGAFLTLLRDMPQDIKISKIFYSHLDIDKVSKYEPESLEFVKNINSALRDSGIPIVSVNAGDRLKLGRTMIRVFSAGDGNFIDDYINNTSVVYKFNMYCSSILFLGDIMREASIAMLEKYKNELNCDIVQMAKHGQYSVLSEVYVMATPDICLWSTPYQYTLEGTYEGEVFLESKRLMEALGATEHYVSGLDGLSEIHISY